MYKKYKHRLPVLQLFLSAKAAPTIRVQLQTPLMPKATIKITRGYPVITCYSTVLTFTNANIAAFFEQPRCQRHLPLFRMLLFQTVRRYLLLIQRSQLGTNIQGIIDHFNFS